MRARLIRMLITTNPYDLQLFICQSRCSRVSVCRVSILRMETHLPCRGNRTPTVPLAKNSDSSNGCLSMVWVFFTEAALDFYLGLTPSLFESRANLDKGEPAPMPKYSNPRLVARRGSSALLASTMNGLAFINFLIPASCMLQKSE